MYYFFLLALVLVLVLVLELERKGDCCPTLCGVSYKSKWECPPLCGGG